MRYRLTHTTNYRYSAQVHLSHHVLHLGARSFAHQRVEDSRLVADPPWSRLTEAIDHFGNPVAHVTFDQPHKTLSMTASALVDVAFPVPPDDNLTPAWEDVVVALEGGGLPDPLIAADVAEFVHPSPLASPLAQVTAYAAESFPAGRPILAAVRELTRRIFDDFVYDPTATDVTTPLAHVIAERRGVCQDFAHLEIAALRGLGLAARYVSGYIRTYRSDETALRGADASHAWCEVWCGPLAGWIGVDPTNDLVVADEHVVLAWGRDFQDVSPIRGVILGGGAHSLSVAVDLDPLGPEDATSRAGECAEEPGPDPTGLEGRTR